MNIKVLSSLLVVALLIVAAVFLLKNKGLDSGDANKREDIKGLYSVDELLKLSRDIECKFENSEGEAEVSGTLFLSEGRVKGDFDIDTGVQSSLPQKFESHFLIRDGFIYSWTSILKNGFKSKVSSSTPAQGGVVGIYEKVEYDCKNLGDTEGLFNIPQDISFTDMQ